MATLRDFPQLLVHNIVTAGFEPQLKIVWTLRCRLHITYPADICSGLFVMSLQKPQSCLHLDRLHCLNKKLITKAMFCNDFLIRFNNQQTVLVSLIKNVPLPVFQNIASCLLVTLVVHRRGVDESLRNHSLPPLSDLGNVRKCEKITSCPFCNVIIQNFLCFLLFRLPSIITWLITLERMSSRATYDLKQGS